MAPWCGHCKTMAKPWNDLATAVHTQYKGVTIGTVNCDTQKEFCAMFKIQGLPTVIHLTYSRLTGPLASSRKAGLLLSLVPAARVSRRVEAQLAYVMRSCG